MDSTFLVIQLDGESKHFRFKCALFETETIFLIPSSGSAPNQLPPCFEVCLRTNLSQIILQSWTGFLFSLQPTLTHWSNLHTSAVQKFFFIIFAPNFWDHLCLALMVWTVLHLSAQTFSNAEQDKSCSAVLSLHIPVNCIIKLLAVIKLIQGLITERYTEQA